jgi:hypothetical protein
LRQAGQIFEIGEEITVIQEKSFNGTLEDQDLDLFVSLNGRDDLSKLADELRAHYVQRRIVERDPPIGGRWASEPNLCLLFRCVHQSLHP